MIKPAFSVSLIVITMCLTGCAGKQPPVVGLDVNVYLHPSSSDPMDALLQMGIAARLSDSKLIGPSVIHVQVADRVVTLTGTAKTQDAKDEAERIARGTELTLNGTAIRPKDPITNRITTQR
jgi:hypothetical protein